MSARCLLLLHFMCSLALVTSISINQRRKTAKFRYQEFTWNKLARPGSVAIPFPTILRLCQPHKATGSGSLALSIQLHRASTSLPGSVNNSAYPFTLWQRFLLFMKCIIYLVLQKEQLYSCRISIWCHHPMSSQSLVKI